MVFLFLRVTRPAANSNATGSAAAAAAQMGRRPGQQRVLPPERLTRIWDEAEQLRDKLEEALLKGLPPFGPQPKSALLPVPADPGSSRRRRHFLQPPSQPPSRSGPSTRTPLGFRHRRPRASGQCPTNPAGRVPSSQPAEGEGHGSEGRRCLHDRRPQPRAQVGHDQEARKNLREAVPPVDKGARTRISPSDRPDALLSFRSTWTEGAIVRAKKQDRVIGFFWDCFRRNFITQNPALSLSKIKTTRFPPTTFPATSSIGSSLPSRFMATLAAALFRSRTPVPDCVL